MVKYKSLIAICGFTIKLSPFISAGCHAVSAASEELGASHRVPQKNKWVSCLSVVRYWVSGLECGQCAKVAGGWGWGWWMLTCFSNLVGWTQRGDWRILFFPFFLVFFAVSNFTNTTVKSRSGRSLMFCINTWLLPGTNMCTFTPIVKPPTHCPITSLCPGAFVFSEDKAQILNFVPQWRRLSKTARAEAEEQWWRMNDLFCFSCTTK